jgi:hypothetical protein
VTFFITGTLTAATYWLAPCSSEKL